MFIMPGETEGASHDLRLPRRADTPSGHGGGALGTPFAMALVVGVATVGIHLIGIRIPRGYLVGPFSNTLSDAAFALAAFGIAGPTSIRRARLLEGASDRVLVCDGWRSRAIVVLRWPVVVCIKANFGSKCRATTLIDHLFVSGICLFLQALLVFNHCVIVGDGVGRSLPGRWFPWCPSSNCVAPESRGPGSLAE